MSYAYSIVVSILSLIFVVLLGQFVDPIYPATLIISLFLATIRWEQHKLEKRMNEKDRKDGIR